MQTTYPKSEPARLWMIGLIIFLASIAIISTLASPPRSASAHVSATFAPACGSANLDGVIEAEEWSSAITQTFQMIPGGSADPLTATLYVMNGGHYLYMGITINDDEFTPVGQYLPQGDGFRIDFDNDHSGSLFALHDDVLSIAAGLPQFGDSHLYGGTNPSSSGLDINYGGTSDGSGAASRVANLNHFELKHPLCSSDPLDFCLHPGDIVGFRMEYLDAQGDGSFSGGLFYPGAEDTSIADILIGTCTVADARVYLSLIQK